MARLFIDDHFCEEIDLTNISGEACFSKFHFIRLFKSIYGTTPHQYVIRKRMQASKELLKSGYTVSETCLSVGFQSLSSFTGLFTRFAGMSPSSFRKVHLLRRALIKEAPLQFIPNCFAEQKGWNQNSNFKEVKA